MASAKGWSVVGKDFEDFIADYTKASSEEVGAAPTLRAERPRQAKPRTRALAGLTSLTRNAFSRFSVYFARGSSSERQRMHLSRRTAFCS